MKMTGRVELQVMRKCPGVRASTPSSSHSIGTRGLLLRQASICDRMVVNSLKVNLTPPTIRFKCSFMLLTAASQSLPK